MPRALKSCPTAGCPELVSQGRCTTCQAQAEARRGTARQRGYDKTHERWFRPQVLRRDPLCTCTTDSHGHGQPCLAPSRHADHHPRSRRELQQLGLDPNDPAFGRGLCVRCHSMETSTAQPGGFMQR